MKHPRMARNPRLAATVAALSGGLDCANAPHRIADTALSDACDMIYRDGVLTTRRGFVTSTARYSAWALGADPRFFVDRDGYLLVVTNNDTESNGEVYITAFAPDGTCAGSVFSEMGPLGLHGFLVPVGELALAEQYTSLLFLNNGDIYGLNAAQKRYDALQNAAYVPTYAINGVPCKTRTERAVIGDRAEPFNSLTQRFRCTYSADGEGIYYPLPRLYQNSDVTVRLTRASDTLTFSVASGSSVSAAQGGYTVRCDRNGGCVWFEKGGTPYAVPSDGVAGNVEVEAMHGLAGFPTVESMGHGVWFADGRLVLGGGSRVMWSAAGNPLYFPVTAYAQVGNPEETVTALGVQGERLVVFKEHSLYAVTVSDAKAATAEQVMSGETVDVTATVQFAVKPLHASVGCDLPQTVALLGNRLVWACADGTVYALKTGGTLSEGGVTVISKAVRPLLSQPPAHAAGVVFDGCYWLLWDNTLLVAEERDELRWMRFSFANTRAVALDLCVQCGELVIPAQYALPQGRVMFCFVQSGTADTAVHHTGSAWRDAQYTLQAVPVKGTCCTKQFDFGDPETYKHVTRVFADVTANGAVQAAYVTEQGEVSELPHTPLTGLRLTPHVARCRRIALRLCAEALQVGSVTWHVITGRR